MNASPETQTSGPESPRIAAGELCQPPDLVTPLLSLGEADSAFVLTWMALWHRETFERALRELSLSRRPA